MVQYIYFVKCPDCDDEPFDFFDEAETYAISLLDKKPIISQTEVCRNDFGECTDSRDLGTVWSWQDLYKDTEEPSADSVFTKDYFEVDCDNDPEFAALDNSLDFEPVVVDNVSDDIQKPRTPILEEEQAIATNRKGDFVIPASSGFGYTVFSRDNVRIGHIDSDTDEEAIIRFNRGDLDEAVEKRPLPKDMTIEQLVEEMEENEDTVECACCQELYSKEDCTYDEKHGWLCDTCQDDAVECTWCEELFDQSECRKEVNLGWLCSRCEAAIKSRGETLTFEEGNYWDCFDEETAAEIETKETLVEEATFNPKSTVDLHYDDITAPIVIDVRRATYWEPEEEITKETTDSFDFTVNADDLATTIWENFITDEDVADVPGGLDALVDNKAWYRYLAEHFDDLVEKYNKELLDYYEDAAIEAASEEFQDNYDNYEPDYDYDDLGDYDYDLD